MLSFECPHCHKRTISFWRKLFSLAPRGMKCPACGAKIAARGKSQWVFVVPFLLVIPLARSIESMAIYLGVLAASLALAVWWFAKVTPMIELKDIEETIDEYYNRY
jgi:DNA-directed RNA polymerase subunit RPC12/RpoP